ncbi:hypothetical protein PENTCL1PPCAC_5409 [Pristionchus entomophagus]|uniref:Uncharacterized protein n=1 Tax=Pristionchus entomophagus TaxID=358040 RepID=A0AAV5SPI6_9BILA|nr:hypothetical protein PENTCL1PPCAC_5409 [Pristionchus entomophagus]
MCEAALAQRWNDLTSFVTEEVRQKWWTKIVEAHKNRRFSGVSHLERMFNEFDKHKDCLKDRYAFAFAIFFKNIVYNTMKSNNPEESAALLRQFSQETTFDQENRVAELIIESGKGSSDVNMQEGATGDDDLHYLLDFDLAFLGDSPSAFVQHELAMRSEFFHLSDMEYATQRLKTFRFFIQIPNIYATKALRDAYEEKARVNIASEIEMLQSGARAYDC